MTSKSGIVKSLMDKNHKTDLGKLQRPEMNFLLERKKYPLDESKSKKTQSKQDHFEKEIENLNARIQVTSIQKIVKMWNRNLKRN